jgi:RNA polymerase sigma factor (TIGR02999 family)
MQPVDPGAITQLLQRAKAGDRDALDALLPMIYGTLKRLAGKQLNAESPGHTLTATALVHEAYLDLFKTDASTWPDRHRFYAYAASAMRTILIDHARARLTEKRGGALVQVDFEELPDSALTVSHEQVLSIDRALSELDTVNPRAARVVELKFFGGLSLEEIAVAEELNERTVRRDWMLARAFLYDALSADAGQNRQ